MPEDVWRQRTSGIRLRRQAIWREASRLRFEVTVVCIAFRPHENGHDSVARTGMSFYISGDAHEFVGGSVEFIQTRPRMGDQAMQGWRFLIFHVSWTAPPFSAFLVSVRVPLSLTVVTVHGPV